jgi:membrane associated rhomboid family serine protease
MVSNKKIVITAVLLLIGFVMVGFVLPYLFSEPSSEAVLLGASLVFSTILGAALWFNSSSKVKESPPTKKK